MNLTRDEAQQRAAAIAVDHYDVSLDLTGSATTFDARTTVRFTCTSAGTATFIDFVGESVRAVTLNGVSLDPQIHYDGTRISLPAVEAENTLVVEGTGRFMNSGEGLHRFVDPVDDEVYLYSQFQVADARRVFPVFDQPDLKAEFAFTVTAPDHWQVVSVAPTPEPVAERDGVATWSFPPSERISSYVTAIVAGSYDVVRDEAKSRAGTVPLAIYCRRSLTKHLDAENIFELTKAGFEFFEREFDCAYPFRKYDQLFTPEYNMGAMENAACVTINEVYVFRARVFESLVERRALTILHELAHMWFGDLVTMQWWDDLWLNESFAEWASTACQAEATRWDTAWTTFGTSEKAWAYDQDQLSSTHPVFAPIRDLSDVEVNFDGITYAKGASVLKQLVAYVGRRPFVDGLRSYFDKHAWGNTTLPDLLGELSAASGRDLTEWSKLWLETAGVNTLRPVVEVDDRGLIGAAAIEQTATTTHPTLRPHRLAVGLYDLDGDDLVRSARFEVDVVGERTDLPQLVGRPQPDLLLVNDDDLAYAKVRLDDRSLATALAHPRGFTDSLPRSLILGAAWDMTRDAEMRARDFVDLVLASLPGETDSTLLKTLVSQLRTALLTYTDPQDREQLRVHALAELLRLTRSAAPGSDAQLQLVTAYAALLADGDDAAYVRELLEGTLTLPGLVVDTELRWTLLTALAAVDEAGTEAVDAERDHDATATGRERASRALAAIPSADAKAAAWRAAVEHDDLPNSVVEAVALGFGRHSAVHLLEPYVERYLAMLEDMWASRTQAIGEAVVVGFYPRALAHEGLLEATQRWLDTHPDAPAALVRLVAENRDGTARALAAQARDRQG